MVSRSIFCALVLSALTLTPAVSRAQAYAPIVLMAVTTPDGQVHRLSVAESGLATVTTQDGTIYGFRPTMQDDRGSQTVVTIFKMEPTSEQVATLDVKLGAAPVAARMTPAFKVAVTGISKSTT